MNAERRSLAEFHLDGGAALDAILRESAYGSIEQAVASLSLFTHADTVAQALSRPLFRIVRGPIPERGRIVDHSSGGRMLLDDNTGPTDAFLWANGIKRGAFADVQFCHIWQAAGDAESYTNLANLCLLPAFLAKLSDTHPEITELLRARAFALYGWQPNGTVSRSVALDRSDLEWAACLPPVANLERALRKEMRTKPKSRTTTSAREIGWLFSDWRPDGEL